MGMKILIDMVFSPNKGSKTRGHEVKLVKDQSILLGYQEVLVLTEDNT